MKVRKGIILAGGTGSRLYPLTIAANKQLLPLYDKPVIYYPLSVLMLAGIREILIISSAKDLPNIKGLLKDGKQFGINCTYAVQNAPKGLPEAFIIAEDFLQGEASMLILGDNFFYGNFLQDLLRKAILQVAGAHLFLHPVDNPSAYGVLSFDSNGNIKDILEKPKEFVSNLAITGLYLFDENAPYYAKQLKPSARGELEITDLIKFYLTENRVSVSQLGRGYVWYDTGTPKSLLLVSSFIETIEDRQGLLISSPEEIALNLDYISKDELNHHIGKMPECLYKNYLKNLL